LCAQREIFPASFFRDFGYTPLAELCLPSVAAKTPNASSVYRVNNYTVLLADLARVEASTGIVGIVVMLGMAGIVDIVDMAPIPGMSIAAEGGRGGPNISPVPAENGLDPPLVSLRSRSIPSVTIKTSRRTFC